MEDEAEETKSAARIFVGGLAEAVSAEDLRSLFASLGSVQSVQTIRTKGRSFAYLDFLSDPKSLSKLFSKASTNYSLSLFFFNRVERRRYNGCLWKGGRLRLEKAKEDYLVRLKREWEQGTLDDATQKPPTAASEEEMPNTAQSSKSNTKHLNIFFPRLRKVKSIPFSGTGKHKYSFQNIKVPPLPVHFCDCEEHCKPFVPEREKLSIDRTAESGGINDEEISIMNAVMNKLFEKEQVSNAKNLGEEKDSFESPDALHSDECEDSATDEDDLIINVETKKNKTSLTEDKELQRILENQESWFNKRKIAKEEPNKSTLLVQKRSNSNPDKNKKRKSLPKLEVSTTPGSKSNMQTLPDEVGSDAQPTELEDDFGEKVSWSQKSSWRELLGDKGNTSFSASLILPKLDSGESQQRSDDQSAPVSTNNKTENMERDGHLGSKPADAPVIEEHAEAQPTNKQVIEDVANNKHNVAPNKTGRGASWLQKQSWTQMVGQNNNSFSISNILPGITFPEPMAKEAIMEPAISNDCKHNGVAKDTVNVVCDGFNSRETIPGKSQHTSANDIASASVGEEKGETSPREKSTENVEIGETCSFMRSAASLKEWAKAKAAMSGSLKRKHGEKGEKEDRKVPIRRKYDG
ncbi:Nucleolar protein 8 [Glycine max]|nr:Nucleolar protein 8 [Glycine max]